MAHQYSVAVNNARLDAIFTAIGSTPVLKIFSGAEPANCAAADPAGLLCTITLPATPMAAASGGSKAKTGTWSGTASGTGIAASYRIYDSGGTVCGVQGSVTATAGGGDLTLDSVSAQVNSGQTVTVATYQINAANT
jgi:hypothetical protein